MHKLIEFNAIIKFEICETFHKYKIFLRILNILRGDQSWFENDTGNQKNLSCLLV